MPGLIDSLLSSVETMMSGTKDAYEMLSSIPVIEILRENVTVIGLSLYLYWYIKAYLSVSKL